MGSNLLLTHLLFRNELWLNKNRKSHRQKVLVPPHGERPGGDALSADDFGDGTVVVDHLQRPEAELADVHRLCRILTATGATA